ncbi:hypothetical protein BGX23_003494, partial [Mortierella sp. AD031]
MAWEGPPESTIHARDFGPNKKNPSADKKAQTHRDHTLPARRPQDKVLTRAQTRVKDPITLHEDHDAKPLAIVIMQDSPTGTHNTTITHQSGKGTAAESAACQARTATLIRPDVPTTTARHTPPAAAQLDPGVTATVVLIQTTALPSAQDNAISPDSQTDIKMGEDLIAKTGEDLDAKEKELAEALKQANVPQT